MLDTRWLPHHPPVPTQPQLQPQPQSQWRVQVKERYKASIASLEEQLRAKEDEKATLVGMCNELIDRLEREGLDLEGEAATTAAAAAKAGGRL